MRPVKNAPLGATHSINRLYLHAIPVFDSSSYFTFNSGYAFSTDGRIAGSIYRLMVGSEQRGSITIMPISALETKGLVDTIKLNTSGSAISMHELLHSPKRIAYDGINTDDLIIAHQRFAVTNKIDPGESIGLIPDPIRQSVGQDLLFRGELRLG
ncbi:MAG: hypothetical protein KGH61_04885 [Candidatus Micrarchaeota archaeon]|nr:hypothetical protein [Candidatus Micrarchaeota archaeon]